MAQRDPVRTHSLQNFRVSNAVDAFLDSPFAGIAPWIVLSLFSGPGRFEEAVAAALGLSILFFLAGLRRGGSIKILEVFDLVFFGTLGIIGILASDGVISWMELWAGEMTNVALTLFAFGSIAVRQPFTLQYAKEGAPREMWDSPIFLKVNYVITAVWGLSFGFAAAVGCYGDAVQHSSDNFWTGWILQIAATIFAISFTDWYPEYEPNRQAQAAGEPTDPPASPIELITWVPNFVLIVGIAGWVTDSIHVALAIVLIALGSAAGLVVRRYAPSRPKAAADQPVGEVPK